MGANGDSPGGASAQSPASTANKKKMEKRAAVSAEASSSTDEVADYQKVVYPKTEEARAFIFSVVADSALFAGASATQRAELVDAMQERPCTDDELVIQQGDDGQHFFVVRSGEFGVYLKQVGDAPVHKYKPGGSFGELALLYNKPRAATIRCTAAGVLYQLDRATFRGVLIAGQKTAVDLSLRMLKKVPLLEGLTDQQYNQLLSILAEEKYEDGQTVCAANSSMDSLFLVKEGLVNLFEGSGATQVGSPRRSLGGGAIVPYQAGDFFGASALSDDSAHKWHGSITAVGSVTLLRLRRPDMLQTLGDLTTLLRDNFQQRVLGSIEMFRMLSSSQVSLLIDSFTEQRYTAGDTVIRQGDDGDTFYIIKSGQVRVSVRATDGGSAAGEREIAKLRGGDYFGEMALLNAAPRMATVTAIEATICMTVDRTTFTQVLGPLKELMDREADRRKAEVEALSKKTVIKLNDLKDLGTLGVGTFGRVKLVEHMPTRSKYALKCMRKRQLIALKQVEHVMNEKNLLGMAKHPFLINLMGAYQDGVELYMLLELALGGELFTRLRDLYRFDEPASRFYAACVTSAFMHLHDLNVVYRDLKPENLLLDSGGYIKLCDFGFAKVVPERTFTLCGTPEYLAPEIISNVGHTIAVDWWAVGILIFEMLTGDPPFVADDPMELYQQILRGSFVYPQLVGKTAKDLITKLLVSNPAMRLGIVKKGHRDLVSHPFFKLVDFAQLVKRTGKPPPPHVPKIRGDADMSNFDELDDGAGMAQDPKWDQPCLPDENALFAGFSM
jgi:CRP-like cAMP-binding protein